MNCLKIRTPKFCHAFNHSKKNVCVKIIKVLNYYMWKLEHEINNFSKSFAILKFKTFLNTPTTRD